MSAQKTERLLNLVICLLATRQFISKDQIRSAIPQYAECRTDDAFEDLREQLRIAARRGRRNIRRGLRSTAWKAEDVVADVKR